MHNCIPFPLYITTKKTGHSNRHAPHFLSLKRLFNLHVCHFLSILSNSQEDNNIEKNNSFNIVITDFDSAT